VGNRKLLERMRASPYGWPGTDVIRLLRSYDFEYDEGGSHTVCTRRTQAGEFLYHTIPRHRKVKSHIVRTAVKLIDELTKEAAENG